ncbi:MAG: response regulator, partial [Pirellula sp.]|nr:response regulator [Pirellula sp.]
MANILIVDDVKDNRDTLKRVLTRFGHASDFACDVDEAVRKVEADHFDLVLMDITIPQTRDGEPDIYGGIEATKRIRSNPRFRNLPIVAVTAHGFHSQRKAILDSGCSEILEKGPEAFIGRTKDMLARILGTTPTVSNNPESPSTCSLDLSPADQQKVQKILQHLADAHTLSHQLVTQSALDTKDEELLETLRKL